MSEPHHFHPLDYVVMVLMLGVSSCIGVYFAWKDRRGMSNKMFLLGNRQLGVFPVSMSLMASFQSATTVLGYPAEMYYKGSQFWVAIIGLAISNVIAGEIFLPVFYNLNLTSVNTLLYMGVVLYGPSVALESVTGLPVWMSVILLGVICTFYTTLGGVKAVVWTDVVQMTIMVFGLFAVCVIGLIQAGGLVEVIRLNLQGGRIQFFNVAPDVHSSVVLWNILFGTCFVWAASYGTSQTQVQRFCSVPSLKQAKQALYWNTPGVMANISLGCFAGLVIFANYMLCDPLKANAITKQDQLMPFFVMNVLGVVPGLPGLFVACVFSGALSTLSSGFNSLAAVTWEDFLHRIFLASEHKAVIITKIVAAAYGFVTILLAFVAGRIGNLLKAAFAMSGALSGPLLGVFTLGVLVPQCNGKGALIGGLLGQVVCLWIVGGALWFPSPSEDLETSTTQCLYNEDFVNRSRIPDDVTLSGDRFPYHPSGMLQFYHVSHLLVPIIGFVVTMVTSMIVSFITGFNSVEDIDPVLLSPLLRKFLAKTESNDDVSEGITYRMSNLRKVHDSEDLVVENGGSEAVHNGVARRRSLTLSNATPVTYLELNDTS